MEGQMHSGHCCFHPVVNFIYFVEELKNTTQKSISHLQPWKRVSFINTFVLFSAILSVLVMSLFLQPTDR